MRKPGRNELCHCGSGKKYKRCCGRKERTRDSRVARIGFWVILVLAVGVVVIAFDNFREGFSSPVALKYDVLNDRHWDPSHGHWHQGPPPDFKPGQLDPATTPEPWQYDPEADRHWNPNHGHWHNGFPPLDPGATADPQP